MTEKSTTKPMRIKDIVAQLADLKAHCSSFAKDADEDHQIWRDDVAALDAALEVLQALDAASVGNVNMAKAAMDLLKSQGQEISRLRALHRMMCQKYADATPPVLQRKRLGTVYLCPECHRSIGKHHSHCHSCGKRILWDDRRRAAK